MDTLKKILETLLLLVIALTILLLFGPIVLIIAIVGKVKWREGYILDITHMGRVPRIALGTVGSVAWLVILIMGIGWIGHPIGLSHSENPVLPLPRNVSQRFDFETGIDDSISLDVCQAIPPTWYENCYRSSSNIHLSSNSFTGGHSLGYQAELLPSVDRVFSVNIPIQPPTLVRAVSASVFIPSSEQPYKIWLLARISGGDRWKVSEISNISDGWVQLYLDLQETQVIDEIDIDIFFPKVSQQSLTMSIEIDDIELYFPASEVLDLP